MSGKKFWSFALFATVLILAAAFRLVVHSHLDWSVILGDELSYKLMAYNYHKYGSFGSDYSIFVSTRIPSNLYPLILSHFFSLPVDFYQAVKIFNQICVFLTCLGIIFLLPRAIDPSNPRTFTFSEVVLVSLVPSFHYSSYAMIESLLFLSFFLWIFTTYRFLVDPSKLNTLAAAFSTCLLMQTKPTMSAAVGGFLVYFTWTKIARPGIPTYERFKNTKNLSLAGVFSLVLYVILFALVNRRLPFVTMLGGYESHAANIVTPSVFFNNIFQVVLIGLGLLGGIAFMFLPKILSVCAMPDSPRQRFGVFLTSSLAGVLLLTATFTMTVGEFHLLHFRYACVFVPFLVLFFGDFLESFRLNRKLKVSLGALTFLAILVFWFRFARDHSGAFSSTFMELSWMRYLPSNSSPAVLLILMLLLLAAQKRLSRKNWKHLESFWITGVFLAGNLVMAKDLWTGKAHLDHHVMPHFECLRDKDHANKGLSFGIIADPGFSNLINAQRIAFRMIPELKFFSQKREDGQVQNLIRALDSSRLVVLHQNQNEKPIEASLPGWRLVEKNSLCSIYSHSPNSD